MLSHNDKNTQLQYIAEIAECLKSGHAAVMVGAGFSRNADNNVLAKKSFPTWNDLADVFYEKLHGFSDKPESKETRYLSPLVLAEEVEAAYGRNVLNRILVDQIPDIEYRPSELHRKLLSLPWNDIFTTNYDTLLERTREYITTKRFNIVTCKEDLVNSANMPRIIKLHGSFPSRRPFIITSEDYRSYPHKFAPFVNTVQQSLLENTLCLVGFSGNDPNFQQWIGWIHDNLGKENSPKIYLIIHSGYDEISDAQEKLLYDKKIVVIDLAANFSKGNYRECIDKFLDYLLDNIRKKDSVLDWPDDTSIIRDLENKNILILRDKLREQRLAYPGWIIAPQTSRYKFQQYIMRLADPIMYRLVKTHEEGEVDFLFEYNWLREKCLIPLFSHDIAVYEAVLSRYDLNNKDKNKVNIITIQSLLLALLRAYRENGIQEKWKNVIQRIEENKTFLTNDQRNRLCFEKCMYALFSFDYGELKRILTKWDVSEQSPEWIIRKAGLLTETNELQQAQSLLQNTLLMVRKNLQVEYDNIRCLSLENVLMSLLNFVENVLDVTWNLEHDNKTKQNSAINYYAERRPIHQKYKADWFIEEERFELLLCAPAKIYRTVDVKQSFDFGRQIITSSFHQDTETLNAFGFLRFFEETGHPFRIRNMISGAEAAKGSVERIAHYNSIWAVVTLLRADNSKDVDFVFNRAVLSNISSSEVDALCRTYIKALRQMKSELYPEDWFTPKNFAEFAASVFPQILSRLCCKCSVEVLDELLELVLDIYNNNCRQNYNNVDKLIERLMRAFSQTQKRERITKLLKFPLMHNDSISQRQFPDPFLFFETHDMQKDILESEMSEISSLLRDAEKDEMLLPALDRLVILFCNGFLSEKQKKQFSVILWRDVDPKSKLPQLKNFNLSILIDLPHPPQIKPAELWKIYLINKLKKYEQSKNSFSSNDHLLEEFLLAAQKKLFNVKDLDILLPLCISINNKLKAYFNHKKYHRDIELFEYDEHEKILSLMKAMAILMLYEPDWQPNEELKKQIDAMCTDLKQDGLLYPGLEFLWGNKCNQSMNFEKLVTKYLLSGYDYHKVFAFDSIVLAIDNKNEIGIELKCLQSLLELVAQQILWRKEEHLVSAINIIGYLVTHANSFLTESLLDQILLGLQYLIEESVIKTEDDTDEASKKGSVRISAARLASRLFQYYKNAGVEVPTTLLKWKKICENPNEFVEIRLQWNNEC